MDARSNANGVGNSHNGVLNTEGSVGTGRFSPIADHGPIGDLQAAALVSTDGTIDFYCCPRFDSPSVFAALLDRRRGGYLRIAPEESDSVTIQLYLPDSVILITRFMTADGVGEVIDFMPIDHPKTATSHHELMRRVGVVRGEIRFTHLALIDAAMNLNFQLDHGAGRVCLVELGTRGTS
jgi:GH15 family glucan-1,4-alpha-glucosidase